MAYTINRTNGSLFATVADGTIDNTTSLIMIGKHYAGFGEALNENLVRLLENHANNTEPSQPQTGQLWYDTSTSGLSVYDSTAFKTVGMSTSAPTAPATGNEGDLWYDTTNSQLNIYDAESGSYILVGPTATSGAGTSGSLVEVIQDEIGIDHIVVKLYVDGEAVAIVSKDVEFTPAVPIAGFPPPISLGIQLADSILGEKPKFVGTATNAELLDDLDSGKFVRSDLDLVTLGATADLEISMVAGNTQIQNISPTADMRFTIAGTDILTLDSVSNRARVADPLSGLDIVNMDYYNANLPGTTGAEIKTLYEGEPDTNAFTDALVIKLAGVDSLVVDYDDNRIVDFTISTIIVTLTGGQGVLSGINLSPGRKVEAIYIASGADRTVNLHAGWKSFGEASPIIVPAGKSLVLSLTSTGTTDAEVYCAAVLEN